MFNKQKKTFYCPWGGKYLMRKCKESIYGQYNSDYQTEDYIMMAKNKLKEIQDKNINLVIASYTMPVFIIIAAAIAMNKTVTIYKYDPHTSHWIIQTHTSAGSGIKTSSLTLK